MSNKNDGFPYADPATPGNFAYKAPEKDDLERIAAEDWPEVDVARTDRDIADALRFLDKHKTFGWEQLSWLLAMARRPPHV